MIHFSSRSSKSISRVHVCPWKKYAFLYNFSLLTLSGFATKALGFFYRIFLTRQIGAEGLGIYQLGLPLFALCHTLCCSGMELAVTRGIAAAKENSKKREILSAGLCMSLGISLLLTVILFITAPVLSICLFQSEDSRYIYAIGFSVPFCTIHSILNSYFFAEKKIAIPSSELFFEQVVRFAATYYFLQSSPSPYAAFLAALLGEIFSTLYVIFALKGRFFSSFQPKVMQDLSKIAAPVTMQRLCTTALLSVEAMLIPTCLTWYGMTQSEALSTFGCLTGVAIPFVLFPTSIFYSISTLLLPSVSASQSKKEPTNLCQSLSKIIYFCILFGLAGSLCFYSLGPTLVQQLFHCEEACSYVKILGLLSPVLYLSITLQTVLNGLGETLQTLWYQLLHIALKLLSILLLLPRMGVIGYLIGVLFSNTVLCFCLFKKVMEIYPCLSKIMARSLLPKLSWKENH